MTPLHILTICFLLLILLFLVAPYYFYRVAFFPKVIPAQETLRMELEKNRLIEYEEIQSWEREEIHIQSPYGYDLFGYYYPFPGSQKTVVFSHGITYSLYGSLKYLPIFRRFGFNLLVYDNRFHGRSGGTGCSFGVYEKFDLKAVIDWVFNRTGPGSIVGTHGESLGAAITLQHTVIDPRISFAISDCAFSDIAELFSIRAREDYHIPSFPFIPIAGWYAKQLLGFNYREASPIKRLDEVETPILFIHGAQDTYIPPRMTKDMVQKKVKGYRAVYMASHAGHAESLSQNRSEYHHQITQFLSIIGLIKPEGYDQPLV